MAGLDDMVRNQGYRAAMFCLGDGRRALIAVPLQEGDWDMRRIAQDCADVLAREAKRAGRKGVH